MYKGLAHAAFVVSDMEKALDFYINKLNFKKAFSMNDKNGNPWIEYLKVSNGQFIELFYGDSAAEKRKGAGYDHLCIEVEDINEIADFMRKQGVPLDVEPKQGSDTNWQCWVHDPDGNRIEFMQLMPTSPQMNS